MKKTLLIVLLLSFGFSQQITHTTTYDNGNIKSITYHKETRTRIEKVKYREYYENGQKSSEETYKDGKEDGKWTGWHKNGQKKSEGTYKDGIKDGKWIHSTDIGNGKYEVKYTKGNIDLVTFTDNLGQTYSGIPVNEEPKADGQYLYQEHEYNFSKYPEAFATIKNGELDGLHTEWYKKGQKEFEVTYKDGDLISSKCWDEEGKKCQEKLFDELVIEDIIVGEGTMVEKNSIITVNYTGWLGDGTKFDSSLNPGRSPFRFTVGAGQVIQGWDEGIPGMRVGGKRKLIIPPSMGYGNQNMGAIPPNSTLIFEVDLLGIE